MRRSGISIRVSAAVALGLGRLLPVLSLRCRYPHAEFVGPEPFCWIRRIFRWTIGLVMSDFTFIAFAELGNGLLHDKTDGVTIFAFSATAVRVFLYLKWRPPHYYD